MEEIMEHESILITVSGPDHPGITASLMNVICGSSHKILDMGQSVTHGLLSLSILISGESEKEESDSPLLKELLFEAKRMNLNLEFEIVDTHKISKEVEEIQQKKFILSAVSNKSLSPQFIRDVAHNLAENNINILRIDNVNGGIKFKSLEITTQVKHDVDTKSVKENLLRLSSQHNVDIAFLEEGIYRRSKRLIVFDMDSTLIQAEVIDELAKAHGVGDEISKITESAMNGEIDFRESLTQRVSKLKGLEEAKLQKILEELPLTPGVEEFVKTVKGLGYKLAIISGGFLYFANAIKEKLGLDYAFANDLEISNGVLTGGLKGSIVDAEQKAVLLELIAQQEKITTDQVVAIGDGANDLPMLSKAGLGIAFHAKEIVRKKADNHMSFGPMTTILYFLGIRDHDRNK